MWINELYESSDSPKNNQKTKEKKNFVPLHILDQSISLSYRNKYTKVPMRIEEILIANKSHLDYWRNNENNNKI